MDARRTQRGLATLIFESGPDFPAYRKVVPANLLFQFQYDRASLAMPGYAVSGFTITRANTNRTKARQPRPKNTVQCPQAESAIRSHAATQAIDDANAKISAAEQPVSAGSRGGMKQGKQDDHRSLAYRPQTWKFNSFNRCGVSGRDRLCQQIADRITGWIGDSRQDN